MKCTVVIVTHGKLANELLETSRMLIGGQDDVITLDFLPDENMEGLIKKITKAIETVPTTVPVLILVDMLSGSPFNASTFIVKNRPGTRVIPGVNIPMLLNILLERSEVENLDELVELAVTVGKNAIKPL